MRVRGSIRCVEHDGYVDPKTIDASGIGMGACGCQVICYQILCDYCKTMIKFSDYMSTLKTMGYCRNCVDVYGRMMGGTA